MKPLSILLGGAFVQVAVAAVEPGSLVTISSAADGTNQAAWWTPLDEAGGYTWLAYLRNPEQGSWGNNNVMVVRRDTVNGAISRDCVRPSASAACSSFADDIGHNQPSIAVDGDGFVHVFTSMHNNAWRYFRSQAPYSTVIVDASDDMPDQSILFTYPVIKRDASGDLWLIIRGDTGDGTSRGGFLYHYDTSAKTWTRKSVWARRSGYSVYPDDIQFSSDGDVHIQWEWSKYPASVGRHEGSYARYRPSSGEFRSITGQILTTPLTQQTPNTVFQPLTSGEFYDNTGSEPPLLQSAKMAIYENAQGGVQVQHAYRFQNETDGPWQVRRARFSGGAWVREILYSEENTSAALGFTHDGTTVRIYYCRSDGSAWALEKSGTAGWANVELQPAIGRKVQRLYSVMRSDGADLLYLAAPTNVDSSTGSVYILSVGGRP